ncbi:hypothetical protein D1872_309670 [compost metagenome]
MLFMNALLELNTMSKSRKSKSRMAMGYSGSTLLKLDFTPGMFCSQEALISASFKLWDKRLSLNTVV